MECGCRDMLCKCMTHLYSHHCLACPPWCSTGRECDAYMGALHTPDSPQPCLLPTDFGSQGVKVTLTDGAAHAVDSSELAFKLASMFAFK